MRPGAWLTWGVLAFFFLNLLGVIATVVLDSVGRQWFNTWLPNGWTGSWYSEAWSEFNLGQVLVATLEITLAVVALSLILAVPASYALARRNFPGKRALSILFVLPILVPPIAYGIPLATVLYKFHLAGSLTGVILANLVPSIPFVVFTMTPFIEQIDPKIEQAARMCGAGTMTVLTRVLAPLLVPGMLAAGILVLVRTFGMFELTFLTSGPDQPDADRLAVFRRQLRGHPHVPVHRRHGRLVHRHHGRPARHRPPLRQPHPARRPHVRLTTQPCGRPIRQERSQE